MKLVEHVHFDSFIGLGAFKIPFTSLYLSFHAHEKHLTNEIYIWEYRSTIASVGMKADITLTTPCHMYILGGPISMRISKH